MPWRFFLTAASGVLVVDQLSKLWATTSASVTLNPGISFSLLVGLPPLLVTFVMTGVVFGVAIILLRDLEQFPAVRGAIVGGGVSNLVDRWWWGGVKDWLPVPFLHLHNNLADYAIVGGLVFLLWQLWRSEQVHSKLAKTGQTKVKSL